MLIALLLNSSALLVISEAVDAVQASISRQEIKALAEINLTKYENFDTTIEESNEGSKGVLAQFNLKTGIEFAESENYKPIKKTNINGIIYFSKVKKKWQNTLEQHNQIYLIT